LTEPRRLVLLRHGRTAANASGRIQGQLDVPLDDVGLAQAAAVADAFADAEPYAVLSSDLSRAAATAQPLADRVGVPVRTDPRLREIYLGTWQGMTSAEATAQFPAEHEAWRAGEDIRRGGGETYEEAGGRAAELLREELVELPAGRTLVAVTHGGTARAALGVLLELEVRDWWRLAPLGNTCWSVLVEADRGWRLERHNAGLGPLLGAATGAHDVGSQAVGGAASSPDEEPRPSL
jgi:broad specificity phosphatase PhoE